MKREPPTVYDYEVNNLIKKLIKFIGESVLEQCLNRYKKSVESSGPIFFQYYLKHRHPWWDSFLEYFSLIESNKSIKKNLTERIIRLAGDAKKISGLYKYMPEKTRNKYRQDLVDDNSARNFLFEIDIAWHFYQKGNKIVWYEDDSVKHPEFMVRGQGFQFNVECKTVRVDTSRKIRRRDFYRLAEKIFPAIEHFGYSGRINIFIDGRLHANDDYLNDLSSQIITTVSTGNIQGEYNICFGKVNIDIVRKSGTDVNFDELSDNLFRSKPNNAHGVIYAKSFQGKPIDPIELTIMSAKADSVLQGIEKKLSKAISNQLYTNEPGIICCYLEGLNDLSDLRSGSGLQYMTSFLLSKDSTDHVAAIIYCTDGLINKEGRISTYYNQTLMFRNDECKFEEAKGYNFHGK